MGNQFEVNLYLQYFANSISRLLLPVDGAHASSCEEMATAMSSAEAAAYKGLQQCIETVMAEVSYQHLIYYSIRSIFLMFLWIITLDTSVLDY